MRKKSEEIQEGDIKQPTSHSCFIWKAKTEGRILVHIVRAKSKAELLKVYL